MKYFFIIFVLLVYNALGQDKIKYPVASARVLSTYDSVTNDTSSCVILTYGNMTEQGIVIDNGCILLCTNYDIEMFVCDIRGALPYMEKKGEYCIIKDEYSLLCSVKRYKGIYIYDREGRTLFIPKKDVYGLLDWFYSLLQ